MPIYLIVLHGVINVGLLSMVLLQYYGKGGATKYARTARD